LLTGPQQAISRRRPSDNLRLASAIVAASEQPGDVVSISRSNMQVLGTGYPAPFLRLRNIAAGQVAYRLGHPTGTEITQSRVAERAGSPTSGRVWSSPQQHYKFPTPSTPVDKGEGGAAGRDGTSCNRLAAGEVHAHPVRS